MFEKNDLVKYMKDGRTKIGKVLNKADTDGGFEYKIIGYGEGKYDPKGPNVFCTDVKLCISAKAKGEIGWQTVIVVVPVMVEVKASGELGDYFEGKLTYNFESGEFDFLGYLINKPILQKIDEEMAKAVRAGDNHLDYIPTQYLCDFIKTLETKYNSEIKPDKIISNYIFYIFVFCIIIHLFL